MLVFFNCRRLKCISGYSSSGGILLSFEIERTISFAIHGAGYLFKGALKDAFRQHGVHLTPEEWVILNLVGDDGIDQGVLVKKSFKEKTNITRLLARMQDKALISRVGHAYSGRQQKVHLTTEGQLLRDELAPLVLSVVAKMTEGISEEDFAVTLRVVLKINENLLNLQSNPRS